MQLLCVEKVREAMSMRLRLILALSIVLTWLPTLGHALGLGEIKLKSGLNQPMVAEIELLQIRDLGANEILPSLASQDDFERAGVSRDFFLTDMRFEVKIRPDGSAFVLVTTRKPVREPFVNFLMEVLWPAGRLLREYTLLMDPPVYADKVAQALNPPQRPQIPAPSIPAEPERVRRPEIQDQVTTVRATQDRVAQPPRVAAPPPPPPPPLPLAPPPPPRVDQQPGTRSVAPPPPPPSYSEDNNAVEETYTTQANDALWNIASLWRPSPGVTIQQTMLAIQRKNPEAFSNGNINELKRGAVLRAPTAEEVRDLTRQEAVAQVAEQERRWRQRLAARSGAKPEVEEATLSDREVAKTYAPETGEQGGRITLASGGESAAGESGTSGEGSGGDQKLSAFDIENELDRITSEKLEAESRISELDALLTQNDSIISLQNEQIARLRERLKELERQAIQGEAVDAPEQLEALELQQGLPEGDLQEPVSTEQPGDFGAGDLSVPEPMLDASLGGEPMVDEPMEAPAVPLSPPMDTPVNSQSGEVPPVNEPLAGRPPVSAPKETPFYEDPIYIGIAVGVVVVAGLLFFVFRRREDEDDDFDLLDDEDLDGFDEDEGDVLEADNEVPLSEIDEDDASMTGQTLDDQIGDSSDVISEADIFMAYGRFPEAIKLLQSAISNDPNHPEVYLKLLEVFVETGDSDSFLSCEAQLQQKPFYGQVADRVNQLRQEFGGALPEAPELSAGFGAGLANESDLGLSDPEFDNPLAGLDDDVLGGQQQGLTDDDFELPDLQDPGTAEMPEASDMQSLADLESSLTADFSPSADLAADLDALADDDLDLGLDAHEHDDAAADLGEAMSEDLSFDEPVDFDPSSLAADLDGALGGDEAPDSGVDAALPAADLDFAVPDIDAAATGVDDDGGLGDLAADLDLAFDEGSELDVPEVPAAPAANAADNDFMADADEAATKLDLARAYIDMGDRAGARDILDEVVKEGNAEQKEEAKALLQKVG